MRKYSDIQWKASMKLKYSVIQWDKISKKRGREQNIQLFTGEKYRGEKSIEIQWGENMYILKDGKKC